jgi:proteasome component ECM29
MASANEAEAKELALVGKVEMRIALTDSEKKLEDLLRVYLAPLLLKLGSDYVAVRNKVRKTKLSSLSHLLSACPCLCCIHR